MTARILVPVGFFLAFAAIGLATGDSRASRIVGLIAAAASAACFAFVRPQEKR